MYAPNRGRLVKSSFIHTCCAVWYVFGKPNVWKYNLIKDNEHFVCNAYKRNKIAKTCLHILWII